MATATDRRKPSVFRSEIVLGFGYLTALLFAGFGEVWHAGLSNPFWYGFLFVWLFAIMLWLAFGVVRHADSLAILLGEPYGTLILTISVISIEVTMISAVMLTGPDNPTLARDTLFSVLMIVLNGMVGLTLLVGALRYKEQVYNLKGAAAYLGVIIPLAGLGIILPRYTTSAPGGEVSVLMAGYLITMSIGLYSVFLAIQTMRHRSFFQQPAIYRNEDGTLKDDHGSLMARSLSYHILLLPLTMLPIILLSKKMAVLVEHGIATLDAPQALGGFLVAILVLSPEGVAAVKAALANKLQRTMNIALGSALSTIGLTIPAILAISLITGKHVELGLEEPEIFLLLFTLLVSIVNFNSERTNVLHGFVHMILFITYIVLIFD
ncbi:MAG: calcium:proton antiporter [Gammaproteobacteria bacterium]|nr:calcium:proton antiporter [Gammaproteobacteria bacterium]